MIDKRVVRAIRRAVIRELMDVRDEWNDPDGEDLERLARKMINTAIDAVRKMRTP